MTQAAPIHAVLFDYGMVLTLGPDPTAWKRMKELTGFDEATLQVAYWEPRHKYDRGDLSSHQYWCQVAGYRASSFLIRALQEADTALWTQPNQPMIDWAAALQGAGIRIGILSNLGDAMMQGVLKTCTWVAKFDHCTWSHTLHLAKPELAIYAHAAQGLGVPARRILFIDDREENVAAARQTGMRSIPYASHATFLESMRSQGFHDLLAVSPVLA